jgi:hypothetical protein
MFIRKLLLDNKKEGLCRELFNVFHVFLIFWGGEV